MPRLFVLLFPFTLWSRLGPEEDATAAGRQRLRIEEHSWRCLSAASLSLGLVADDPNLGGAPNLSRFRFEAVRTLFPSSYGGKRETDMAGRYS